MIKETKVQSTAIVTSDTAVKTSSARVFWVTASAGATGGAWQLNNSTDDSGTDLFSAVSPANSIVHILLDPPLAFPTALFADIPGSNITLTIGYI